MKLNLRTYCSFNFELFNQPSKSSFPTSVYRLIKQSSTTTIDSDHYFNSSYHVFSSDEIKYTIKE